MAPNAEHMASFFNAGDSSGPDIRHLTIARDPKINREGMLLTRERESVEGGTQGVV